jgi:hypothetical protein
VKSRFKEKDLKVEEDYLGRGLRVEEGGDIEQKRVKKILNMKKIIMYIYENVKMKSIILYN